MIVDEKKLLETARRVYGTNCSSGYCQAGCEQSRMVEMADRTSTPLNPIRDPEGDGTWITVRVFVADEEVPR